MTHAIARTNAAVLGLGLMTLLGGVPVSRAAVAPNGLIAYTACAYDGDLGRSTCDVWVTDPAAANATPRNLTNTPDLDETDPVWSPDGSRIAFVRDLGNCNTNLWVMNANGTDAQQVTLRDRPGTTACQLEPTWAPDGTRLAFLRTNPSTFVLEIVVIEVASGEEQVIAPPNDPAGSFGALELAWSPDGGKIAFSAVRDELMEDPVTGEPVLAAQYEIVTINPDGSGEQIISAGLPGSRRAATLEEDRAPAWSPDGAQLVFMSQSQDPSCCGPWQLWVASRDGSRLEVVSPDPSVDDMFPSWSPDGTLILFNRSTVSGTDLFVLAAPGVPPPAARAAAGADPARQVTYVGNAVDPSWAPFRDDAPAKRLRVRVHGHGRGSVVSAPAGLVCGRRLCRMQVAARTLVTLTAIPAPGSTWRGWSGRACRGVPGPTCSVTVDRDLTVGIRFGAP